MKAISLPISTDRLSLRLFTPDDVDDMYAYQGLAEVAQYLYRPPRSWDHCAEVIAKTLVPRWDTDGDSLTLAACRREEPGVVGEVKLTLASVRAKQMEIGWVLNPRHEKQGFATEAARALAAAAFDQLGMHRIYARLDVENTGSVRLCERLGMRREAHLVEKPGLLRSLSAGHGVDEVVGAAAGPSGGAGDVGLAVAAVVADGGVA